MPGRARARAIVRNANPPLLLTLSSSSSAERFSQGLPSVTGLVEISSTADEEALKSLGDEGSKGSSIRFQRGERNGDGVVAGHRRRRRRPGKLERKFAGRTDRDGAEGRVVDEGRCRDVRDGRGGY